MPSEHSEDKPGSPNSQGIPADFSKTSVGNGWVPAPRGDKVVQLLDLSEIQERWGIGEYRIYRAVALGQIRAYGRPGRQKYYSAAEIEAWLSSSVIGRQLRFTELDNDALSA